MKTLILGLGNPILSDDNVGPYVTRKLKQIVKQKDIEYVETCTSGLNILDLIVGYDKVIIIDSIRTNQVEIGRVFKLKLEDLGHNGYFTPRTPHYFDLRKAIEIGQKINIHFPSEIKIYAIAVEDNYTFSESFTPEIRERLPKIVKKIAKKEFPLS